MYTRNNQDLKIQNELTIVFRFKIQFVANVNNCKFSFQVFE